MLAGMVTRFAEQKGLDLVAEVIPSLEHARIHVAILGTGDPALEHRLRDLAAAYPHVLTVRVGFDVGLARRIYAGCDALLMPSRFEPCGLNQLYAMRYGTVPIVHAVGGLRDTVDETTGVSFQDPDVGGLGWALARAVEIFTGDPPRWSRMMAAGMERDSSWAVPARQYRALYQQLTGR
jgi:starch synthase